MARTLVHRRVRNDLEPALTLQAVDLAGDPRDLTGATAVVFSMQLVGSSTKKINRAAATIVAAATGIVRYTWSSGDVDTAGTYVAEFEVTIGGRPMTIPGDDQILNVVIRADTA